MERAPRMAYCPLGPQNPLGPYRSRPRLPPSRCVSGRGAAGERNHLMLSEFEAVAFAILLTLAVNAPGAHAVDLDAPVTSIETAIDQSIPRSNSSGPLSLAGEGRGSEGKGLEHRGGQTYAGVSQWADGTQADLRSPHEPDLANLAILFEPSCGRGQNLRDI